MLMTDAATCKKSRAKTSE